jgi:hypothetical protein
MREILSAMNLPVDVRCSAFAMRRFLPAALALVLIGTSASAAEVAKSGAVIRESGAIYLEDLLPKPVQLVTKTDAQIFYRSDLARYLGTLKAGQRVELQAVSDSAYRVRGIARQGQVAGWVSPEDLTPLKQDFVKALRQNATRQEEVAALIARKEVAINMTPEEVRTALGKPSKKTSRLDANGRKRCGSLSVSTAFHRRRPATTAMVGS